MRGLLLLMIVTASPVWAMPLFGGDVASDAAVAQAQKDAKVRKLTAHNKALLACKNAMRGATTSAQLNVAREVCKDVAPEPVQDVPAPVAPPTDEQN